MPRIVETTIYCLDELAEGAKDQARSWYRDIARDDDWQDCVLEDFETVCAILGVRLKTTTVRLFGGGTRQKPCIYFSGFWLQGDSASFQAVYSYEKDAPRKIREHAPLDAELDRIVVALQAVQARNFYQLRADAVHRGPPGRTS